LFRYCLMLSRPVIRSAYTDQFCSECAKSITWPFYREEKNVPLDFAQITGRNFPQWPAPGQSLLNQGSGKICRALTQSPGQWLITPIDIITKVQPTGIIDPVRPITNPQSDRFCELNPARAPRIEQSFNLCPVPATPLQQPAHRFLRLRESNTAGTERPTLRGFPAVSRTS